MKLSRRFLRLTSHHTNGESSMEMGQRFSLLVSVHQPGDDQIWTRRSVNVRWCGQRSSSEQQSSIWSPLKRCKERRQTFGFLSVRQRRQQGHGGSTVRSRRRLWILPDSQLVNADSCSRWPQSGINSSAVMELLISDRQETTFCFLLITGWLVVALRRQLSSDNEIHEPSDI